jgi:hypothetical protein
MRFFSVCLGGTLLLAGILPGAAAQVSRGGPVSPGIVASPVSLGTSPQLFATMCALYAAGYDAEATVGAGDPAGAALRREMLELQGPATEALRAFYREHALADSNETLSRYISFALVVGPPPKFPFLLDRDELPPDVLAIDGFDEVFRNFYAEAQLDQRWTRIEPGYRREVAPLDGPVRQIVMVTSGYLREISRPVGGRTFGVIIEPLIGGRTNFRNYGDHYFVVLAHGSNPPLDDIRHAYLHFLLDPLPLRYRSLVDTKKGLLRTAAQAPQLPVVYQEDFVGLFTECLIKAVELRLQRLKGAELETELSRDDSTGFVLVRPLVQRLQIFEKAEPAMSFYFPDLVRGIDVKAEEQRLQKVQFAAAEPPPAPPEENASAPQPSELETSLAEGDRQIAAKDGAGAAATFGRILEKYPNLPRALYGLAIASVLQGRADEAKELFERVIAAPAQPSVESADAVQATEPGILAWSHIYLGRIHDMRDERVLALSEYRAALAVEGAPEAARVAAQRGMDASYQPSAKGNRQPKQQP